MAVRKNQSKFQNITFFWTTLISRFNLKFSFSEKATKSLRNLPHVLLSKYTQILVAFSENLNFNWHYKKKDS